MKNPYLGLDGSFFWKKAVVEKTPESLKEIYKKKFSIKRTDKVATAGSCFAQHVSKSLKSNGFNVINKESSDYSANHGNIYTVAQLLQLTKESIHEVPIDNVAWEKDGEYVDALRPGAFSSPFKNYEDVSKERLKHLQAFRSVLKELDVFIFTLGLTEAWLRKKDKVVFPSAPGVIAGEFEESLYKFKNYDFESIVSDFKEFITITKRLRGGKSFKIILTVSPVPLTATASKQHILVANTYSKATLRAVAGCLSKKPYIDYFPSYEIVTNPRYYLESYDTNLRTVKQSTVDNVMNYFFKEHTPWNKSEGEIDIQSIDIQCEDQLLEMYSDLEQDQGIVNNQTHRTFHTEIIGDSHMNSFVKALKSSVGSKFTEEYCVVDRRVLKDGINPLEQIKSSAIYDFSDDGTAKSAKFIRFATNAKEQVETFKGSTRNRLILVGNLMGDNFLRFHGTITESESPEIPMITTLEEISDHFQAKINTRMTYAKDLVRKALQSLDERNIRWVVSPLPSESCAVERFGSTYVNSKSQVLYNQLFDNLLEKVLGEHIRSGIIITQPKCSISETGFSYDKYAFRIGTNDVHLSENYFCEVIEKVLNI